jgi:glycosyltransferase involved in cell wall biosynthesis
MDILVLPTHREGFPLVLLEAAAMGLPIVATRVTGCLDAVQDNMTGTLVPAADAGALAVGLNRYVCDPVLRRRHGEAAREWVLREFRPENIWQAVYHEYVRWLLSKGFTPQGKAPLEWSDNAQADRPWEQWS